MTILIVALLFIKLHTFIILQRFHQSSEMLLSFHCNTLLRNFLCNCFQVLIQYWFSGGTWKVRSRWEEVKGEVWKDVKLQMEIFWNILKYSPFLVSLLRKVWMSTCSNSGRSFYSIFQSQIQIAKYFTIALEWHNLPTFQMPEWDGNFVSHWAAYYIFNTSAVHIITMFQTFH